jgi:glutamate carboxypeptidase
VLARHLRDLGARVDTIASQGAGDHLRAELGEAGSPLLLLGHFDTVWPVGQLATMPVRQENGRLYGPGVFDMKAGIVIALLACRCLLNSGRRPMRRVVMLWTTDEETGSTTSRAVIERQAAASRAVLVLEPGLPGGGLKTARKGVGEYRLTADGVAAHAGLEPGRGASAIHELAWQVTELTRLQDLSLGRTVNVGTISGGSRSNVVAETAAAAIDVRVSTLADARAVAEAFGRIRPRDPRVRLEVSGGLNRPPLERTAGVAALYELARTLARSCGRELEEGSAGGGSDGNFTAALGVPTLDGLGAVGDGAHALHEHVDLETIPFRAALLAALMLSID